MASCEISDRIPKGVPEMQTPALPWPSSASANQPKRFWVRRGLRGLRGWGGVGYHLLLSSSSCWEQRKLQIALVWLRESCLDSLGAERPERNQRKRRRAAVPPQPSPVFVLFFLLPSHCKKKKKKYASSKEDWRASRGRSKSRAAFSLFPTQKPGRRDALPSAHNPIGNY